MNVEIAPELTPSDPGQHTSSTAQFPVPAGIRRIVLIGFMGAGKSTAGRLLAQHLGWEFLDLDRLIEGRTGVSIPSIFAEQGEARFRQLESEALASALGRTNVVLALGGGAPESLTNRLLLEQTPGTVTVFLDAPFPALFDRCMLQALNPGATDRPLLADPVSAESRYAARQPVYRRLARLTVATGELTAAQTVETMIGRLRVTGSTGKL